MDRGPTKMWTFSRSQIPASKFLFETETLDLNSRLPVHFKNQAFETVTGLSKRNLL